MKRWRWTALVMCLVLLFLPAAPLAGAEESVYFVAAGNEVLPLSDETMPFWSNGYLYVAASVFTASTRQSLGISYTGSSQRVILYSGGDHSLIFDLDKNYAYDSDGNVSYPGALRRNGVNFVPAYLAARYFGLVYSVMDVEHGHLVWLRQSGVNLTDKQFANAAAYPCSVSYADYLRRASAPAEPEPEPEPEDPAETTGGKSVYLCIQAGENADTLLDALDRYHAQAAFFCTPEYLESHGGTARRMTVSGSSIGLLIDGEGDVAAQLEHGSRALRQATQGGTRLAMVSGGGNEALRTAQELGYRCVTAAVDRSGYALKTGANAQSLMKRITACHGSVSVWLGGSVTGAGLRAFLQAAGEADNLCLAMTETT